MRTIFLKCITNIDPFTENKTDLIIGKYYVMNDIFIGQSKSKIITNGNGYNSVMFEYYDDFMKPFDIYNSEFNNYLGGIK